MKNLERSPKDNITPNSDCVVLTPITYRLLASGSEIAIECSEKKNPENFRYYAPLSFLAMGCDC